MRVLETLLCHCRLPRDQEGYTYLANWDDPQECTRAQQVPNGPNGHGEGVCVAKS